MAVSIIWHLILDMTAYHLSIYLSIYIYIYIYIHYAYLYSLTFNHQ